MESDPVRHKPSIRPKDPEPRPTEKQQPSSFDRVLEQSRAIQQSPTLQQQSARQGNEEGQREERRDAGRDRRRHEVRPERERETIGTTRCRAQKEHGEEGPQHRVVVKTQLKREQGGGQGQGGEAGGHGGQGTRHNEATALRRHSATKGVAGPAGAPQFHDRLHSARQRAPTLSGQQLQQLVHKLVAYLRVGKTVVGGHELQVGMNDTVFRGLRLRLTSKGGRVTVAFESQDADVRALFTRERDHIRRQLEAKGVQVAAIQVAII